ncbi:ribose-5-phosphate isomerase RpiA [Baekduia soli]|uniref:Ribose 5-phosphate isomerase A n=1 Tax=Baekduia soli TaxID=496014 RepID=A0A5B8U4H4_9ACTN|nr:ribose-5-phosphate isomerase RpiA [Baekduia soli]QEC47785.1 ribose-5-phosphate isomerase RpiA [Baekduia soli]
MSQDPEDLKRAAAQAAAELVADGMRLGLGTGSTVRHLLPAIAARGLRDLRCVATSEATAAQARELGLPVEAFEALDALDLAIDGADQVAPDLWLVKGGGGAHVREKVVAEAAARFVVIVDERKVVPALGAPVPLELLAFGLPATLAAVAPATVRPGAPPSPDGHVIADHHGPVDDPAALAARLDAVAGVVGHGLFAPALVHDVLVARPGGVEHLRAGGPRS